MVNKESWMYRSGDIWLPPQTVKFLHTYIIGNDTTLFYLNYWHIMHGMSGILFGFLTLVYRVSSPFVTYFVLHTLWEIWQLWIGMTKPDVRGIIDIGVDTLVGLLGLLLVRIYA